MSADGTISATSAVLASCTITNGSLTIKSGNTTIFSVSSSGITWNLSNSSMSSDGTITASNANINGVITSAGSNVTCKVQNGRLDFFPNNDLDNSQAQVIADTYSLAPGLTIKTNIDSGIRIENNSGSNSYSRINLTKTDNNIKLQASGDVDLQPKGRLYLIPSNGIYVEDSANNVYEKGTNYEGFVTYMQIVNGIVVYADNR